MTLFTPSKEPPPGREEKKEGPRLLHKRSQFLSGKKESSNLSSSWAGGGGGTGVSGRRERASPGLPGRGGGPARLVCEDNAGRGRKVAVARTRLRLEGTSRGGKETLSGGIKAGACAREEGCALGGGEKGPPCGGCKAMEQGVATYLWQRESKGCST